MPVVHVPASLRNLTDGRDRLDVAGETLRQVFDALERECPDLTARILQGGQLRSDIAVAIDGTILEGSGLIQPVGPNAEIYLVPPIGGGSQACGGREPSDASGGREPSDSACSTEKPSGSRARHPHRSG